jgi:hypothetical protein
MKKLEKLKENYLNKKISADFWALQHLVENVQKIISNEMIIYW